MSAQPTPSGLASTPQPTPQYGQVVRMTGGCGSGAFIGYRRSIDVLLVAALLLEIGHERDGLVGGAHAVLRHDVDQRALHILGHALGVAAHVHMSAVRE